MRGKLEVLFGGLLLASAMVLAGCVAQTADDEEVLDETANALLVEEVVVGGDDGDGRGTMTPRGPDSATTSGISSSVLGNDCATDPQPNPWVPQSPAPPPGDPGPHKNQAR